MYSIRQTALIFTWIQTQTLVLAFLHLVDGTNETGRFTAMQYIWLITLRQTIHVAMGTFRGKTGSKKQKQKKQKRKKKRGPVQGFLLKLHQTCMLR